MNLISIKVLHKLEITLLYLFLICLPSFEAPKNIFLGLYAIVASYRMLRYSQAKFAWTSWDWTFSCLLVSILVAGWGTPHHLGGPFLELGDPLACLFFCWLLSKSGYNSQDSIRLVLIALIATTLSLTYSIYDKFSATAILPLELNSVGHVNHSSIYLCIGFGFCLALLAYFINKKSSYWAVLFMAIYLLAGIIISDSRATVGIAMLLVFLSLFFFKEKLPKVMALISLIVIATSLFVFQPSVIKKQIEYQNTNNTLSFRDRVWNLSFEIATINPVLGIGNSQFNKVKPADIQEQLKHRHKTYEENRFLFAHHSHNLFLNVLAERGIFGLLALSLFLLKWLWDSTSKIKQVWSPDSSPTLSSSFIAQMSLLTWVVVVGVGLVNTTLHHEHGMLSLLALGLMINSLTNKT